MNYTKLLRAGAALAIGTSIAACSSHGSNSTPLPAVQQSTAKKASAKLTITIPRPAASSASRSPKYISQNTKSASITEADTGAAPQTIIADLSSQSPNCASTQAGLTCSIDVPANPGMDTFTVTLFDGANATGNKLSSGSFSAQVVAGTANSFPLTLTGIVGKITVTMTDAYPVVGTSDDFTVNVQDASGSTIIGPYDAPVTIAAPNGVTLSKTTLSSSTDGSKLTATLAPSVTAPFVLSATAATVSNSVTVHPASGVVLYPIGSDPTQDLGGFPIVAGRDGNLYYGTIGACDNSGCNAGVVGKLNPATGAFTEVPVGARVYGVTQTSDGAVWAGTNNGIMRIAPGNFTPAGLTQIAVPAASNGSASRVRRFAEVASAGADTLWFTDQTTARIGSINVAGPYATSSVTMYGLPNGPTTGTMHRTASPNGIVQWSADGNLYVVDYNNGLLDVVNPANGSVISQLVLPEQIALGNAYGAFPRFVAEGPDHKLYISESQQGLASPFNGVLESYDANGFAAIALPGFGHVPDDVAAGGSGANATVANADLSALGVGIYDIATKSERTIPMGDQFTLQTSGLNPNGVAVPSDGSVWFTSYGDFNGAVLPLMLEHVVYTSSWSVYPRGPVNLFGTGVQSADLMGVVEHGNSGPFTVTSSDPNVASAQSVQDHNFMVVGNGAGTCVLTVTDASNRSYSFTVNVTSTGGTVQSARRKAE